MINVDQTDNLHFNVFRLNKFIPINVVQSDRLLGCSEKYNARYTVFILGPENM